MKRPSRVHELIPLVNGLFAHMEYQFWDFTPDELEILMESRFGQRPAAPLLDIIQGPPDDPFAPRTKLNDEQLALLASIILSTFRNKWDRLSAIHSLEYDVLRNYLDEYQEVVRDDADESTAREVSRANEDSEVSRLTTTSGVQGEQSNVSSNESTNTRNDAFTSDFSRVSKDSQVRTDDLEEAKVRNEATTETQVNDLQESITKSNDSASVRTDNLTDAATTSGSENVTHSGGDYQESTERTLASTGTENGSTGLYGFNSSEAVGDSTLDNDASRNENETVLKTHTGSRTDNTTTSQTSTTHHTGTQENESELHESSMKANTGTQQTDTDVDETYIKANRGTQGIEEDTSISDATRTTDEQESTSLSHGASSGKTASQATTDSDTESTKNSVSRLNDSVIVNRALARAKQSIHRGNIGNLTPQQLITQEIELWRWNFIDEVMSDIKSMITIPIYI